MAAFFWHALGLGQSFGFAGGDGVDRSEFKEISSKAQKAYDDAKALLNACKAAHPLLCKSRPPTVHLVDKLWASLAREFRAGGIILKRRPATSVELVSAKITSKRPRFFVNVHVKALYVPYVDGSAAPATAKKGKSKGKAKGKAGGGKKSGVQKVRKS